LFYRLVAVQVIPNTTTAYRGLSRLTAEARRDGSFPALIDRGRTIHQASLWTSPEHALASLHSQYRLDRTADQDVSIYIGVEKAGSVMQLQSWFGDYGIPILALGGYSSQTYVDEVADDVAGCGRGAVLLYAGDFDPSGEDIDRDFEKRSDCSDEVVRVALTAQQVTAYRLPPAMGKAADTRANAFVARHGALVQVELDALPPDVLQSLYQGAIDQYWDTSGFETVLEREAVDLQQLGRLGKDWDRGRRKRPDQKNPHRYGPVRGGPGWSRWLTRARLGAPVAVTRRGVHVMGLPDGPPRVSPAREGSCGPIRLKGPWRKVEWTGCTHFGPAPVDRKRLTLRGNHMASAAVGAMSPDGQWRWDGAQWAPAGVGPGVPPAAPPKKKRHIIRNVGIAFIALIVVIAVASTMSKGTGTAGTKVDNPPAAATQNNAPATTSGVKTFNVGDTIKVGDNMLFKVDSVESSAGAQFETPTKGQFLIAHVTMTNNGASAVNVSSMLSFELRDDAGESYNETILTTAPKPPDGSIAANDKLAGGLTYDVPKGKTFKMYYKNDVFSGGQVIVNLGAH